MRKNQKGVVSLIVSITIMVILTLIAIAFAQIMRREQRQALDRQLSSQAFYAAEAAINDVARAYANGDVSGASLNNCDSITALQRPSLDGNSVEYSCVSVVSTPDELIYASISEDKSTQLEFQAVNSGGAPSALSSLSIYWEDDGTIPLPAYSPLGGLPNLPRHGNWPAARPGMLRVEIVPIPDSTNIGRAQMMNDRRVFYLYPSSDGPGSIAFSTASGSVIGGDCDQTNSPRHCGITFTGLGFGANARYVVRLRSVYQPVSATVRGRIGIDNANFAGAQLAVDATGRANDVLRRVRAYLSPHESIVPEYVLQSFDGVCKRISIAGNDSISYNCPN